MAVPATDDLIELREAVQGSPVRRDRGDRLLSEHEKLFQLLDRSIVRRVVDATHAQLIDLLAATYRGARRREAERAEQLKSTTITLASEFFLFARR
jgi:hypothetical protein